MPVTRTLLVAVGIVVLARTATAEPWSGSVGLALGWERRADYAPEMRSHVVPELVATLARPVRDKLFVRPALRIGYVGLQQAAMSDSLHVTERDVSLAAEMGAQYVVLERTKAVVVPAWAIGTGIRHRSISFDTNAPIDGTSGPRGVGEWLPTLHAQAGIGIQLLRRRLAIEPYLRYEHVFRDDRIRWQYGIAITVSLW
jgi:hypothetical protein